MSNGDSSKFDAYYKWLGIPKRQQPPNHYRILSLKLFESDAASIEAAAQRQTTFVLDCAKEKHQELGQKLVGEIAAAKECLLNPETRATYDEELRKQLSDGPARRTKQSRYDVQVAHGATFEVPEVTLPATAPAVASGDTPEASPASPHATSAQPLVPQPLELKDDTPPVPAAPPLNDEPIVLPFTDLEPEKPARPAKPPSKTKSSKPAPHAPPAAPPIHPSTRPPVVKQEPELNTGKIIKLVAIACLLAGGVTIGVLQWMSSSSSRTPSEKPLASVSTPATPHATTALPAAAASALAKDAPPATKPAAQASAAPATQAASKPPVAAATPKPAASPAAPAPKPEARSQYWPKLANAVVLVSTQQPGPPSVLNLNEDGTYDSPNLGAGRWRLVDTTLFLDGKSGTITFGYDPAHDTLSGERGRGSIVSRRPLTGGRATPAQAAPAPAPAPAPAGQREAPAAAAPPAAPAGATESGWMFPLRSVLSFRRAWVKGDPQGTVDFDDTTNSVTIESADELGGFAVRKPWKEISFTVHAETITGRLEIAVNKTTLKFNTATALIRKPATISLQYDPASFKLSANIGSRQIATATVLEEDFTSHLVCRLRCEGGKARLKLSDVKVLVP